MLQDIILRAYRNLGRNRSFSWSLKRRNINVLRTLTLPYPNPPDSMGSELTPEGRREGDEGGLNTGVCSVHGHSRVEFRSLYSCRVPWPRDMDGKIESENCMMMMMIKQYISKQNLVLVASNHFVCAAWYMRIQSATLRVNPLRRAMGSSWVLAEHI